MFISRLTQDHLPGNRLEFEVEQELSIAIEAIRRLKIDLYFIRVRYKSNRKTGTVTG